MPSWPSESTMTFMPSPFPTVTPRMLPIKHLSLVVKAVPSPGEPMEITLSAVVMLAPASRPMPMLLLPVANLSAPRPKAWLSLPDTLSRSAAVPNAVLLEPVDIVVEGK